MCGSHTPVFISSVCVPAFDQREIGQPQRVGSGQHQIHLECACGLTEHERNPLQVLSLLL